jgi:hypothetical protein
VDRRQQTAQADNLRDKKDTQDVCRLEVTVKSSEVI